MSAMTYLKEQAGDAIYQYFEPIRALFRYFLLRHYRVSYTYMGMTLMRDSKTFTAWHDREARRKARSIAGSNTFDLEMYRPLKLK